MSEISSIVDAAIDLLDRLIDRTEEPRARVLEMQARLVVAETG